MKKKMTYIRPTAELVVTGCHVCQPAINGASVYKDSIKPSNKIDDIDVKEEDETNNWDIWDNKSLWGDD